LTLDNKYNIFYNAYYAPSNITFIFYLFLFKLNSLNKCCQNKIAHKLSKFSENVR